MFSQWHREIIILPVCLTFIDRFVCRIIAIGGGGGANTAHLDVTSGILKMPDATAVVYMIHRLPAYLSQ